MTCCYESPYRIRTVSIHKLREYHDITPQHPYSLFFLCPYDVNYTNIKPSPRRFSLIPSIPSDHEKKTKRVYLLCVYACVVKPMFKSRNEPARIHNIYCLAFVSLLGRFMIIFRILQTHVKNNQKS